MVSDERAREIFGMISEWEEGENMAEGYLVVASIKALLADREKSKRDKEAVIAMMEEDKAKAVKDYKQSQSLFSTGVIAACNTFLAFIRNPKEAKEAKTGRTLREIMEDIQRLEDGFGVVTQDDCACAYEELRGCLQELKVINPQYATRVKNRIGFEGSV